MDEESDEVKMIAANIERLKKVNEERMEFNKYTLK